MKLPSSAVRLLSAGILTQLLTSPAYASGNIPCGPFPRRPGTNCFNRYLLSLQQPLAYSRMSTSTYKPPEEYLGNLTETQSQALKKLKAELEGKVVEDRTDDVTLLRFLRAREFDVPKAKDMFVGAEEWRKDFGVEDIVKNFRFDERSDVNKYYPHYFHGRDKNNRPIIIHQYGKLDADALFSSTSPSRLLQHFVSMQERLLSHHLPEASHAAGHPVDSATLILDFADANVYTYHEPRVEEHVKSVISIAQERYPETLDKVYLINYPFHFPQLSRNIIPQLAEGTKEKVVYAPAGVWLSKIDEAGKENLPRVVGGTCECGGNCRE